MEVELDEDPVARPLSSVPSVCTSNFAAPATVAKMSTPCASTAGQRVMKSGLLRQGRKPTYATTTSPIVYRLVPPCSDDRNWSRRCYVWHENCVPRSTRRLFAANSRGGGMRRWSESVEDHDTHSILQWHLARGRDRHVDCVRSPCRERRFERSTGYPLLIRSCSRCQG